MLADPSLDMATAANSISPDDPAVLDPNVVKFFYFQGMKDQREACVDRYPEYDAVAIFPAMVTQHSTDFTRSLPAEKLGQLPRFLAELHRAASRFRLQRYPGVEETSSARMDPIRSSSSITRVKMGSIDHTNWFLFK